MKNIYKIGKPKQKSFGVGAVRDNLLPEGWKKLKGHNKPKSDNYGNVLDVSGSVMVWVPAFYFKWTTKNKCKISPKRKKGYMLHRAFYDGGKEQEGFFIDKYLCGIEDGIFKSKKDLNFIGSNNLEKLKNKPTSNLGGFYKAAKTRGSEHFITSIFIFNALDMLQFANDNNKAIRRDTHNNQKCGVVRASLNLYEMASGFIKLDAKNNTFLVLNIKTTISALKDEDIAYKRELYTYISLSGFKISNWNQVKSSNTVFKTSDTIHEISNYDDYIKTCMGIPDANSTDCDSKRDEKMSDAGMFYTEYKDMACLVGGNWYHSSAVGVFSVTLNSDRTDSSYSVGGRASVYVS